MYSKKLFGLNKGGTYKVWEIEVTKPGTTIVKDGEQVEFAEIIIKFGQEGGTMTTKVEDVTVGKQGRSVYEQAVFQAEARIKTQIDKNYRETKEELNDIPVIAMLAKDHAKDGKEETISEGVYTSDKLDGVRCLAKCFLTPEFGIKDVTIESRTGQPYDVPHIKEELLGIMDVGDILDGELYVHCPALQEITSAVTRTDPQEKIDKAYKKVIREMKKGTEHDGYLKAVAEYEEAMQIAKIRPELEFRVFDVVIFDMPFRERLVSLYDYADRFTQGGKVVLVPYKFANNLAELTEQLKDAISRGFEGIMYRTKDGEYESGKRSRGLWKFKLFFDEEFGIVRTSKDKQGYVVFELLNNLPSERFIPGIEYINGHAVFKCVLGDYTWRLAVADDDFSDQYMTVQFQSRYKKTLLPQFPTGKVIRKGRVINGVFVPEM